MCGEVKLTVVQQAKLMALRGKPASAFYGHISHVIANATGVPFCGFARKENLDTTWQGKVVEEVKLEVVAFKEKGVWFERRGYLRVVIVNYSGSKEARIVTEPADKLVARVHHRQPVIIAA